MNQTHSELVEYTRLETQFRNGITTHIYHEAGRIGSQRRVRREEQWVAQKMLGQGAHGLVWQEKCVLGQEVKVRAVKRIGKSKAWQSADHVRELEIVAKFSHPMYEPCFVKSLGWYENQDAVFIAMEYLIHGDLQTHLNVTGRLEEPEARTITFQILEGLHYMHKNRFAHRDLKPANVLIKSMPPDNWWVKLCDFGISKNLEDGIRDSTLKGTLDYMAPELLDDQRSHLPRDNQAADIWALGEIVVRILTGDQTFQPRQMVWRYVQNDEPFPLERLYANGIQDNVCQFVMSLMMASPEARLTSENALRHEWMTLYESPSLDPLIPQFTNSGLSQKPVFLANTILNSDSTSKWTDVSNPLYANAVHGTDNTLRLVRNQFQPFNNIDPRTYPSEAFITQQSQPAIYAAKDGQLLDLGFDQDVFQAPKEPSVERPKLMDYASNNPYNSNNPFRNRSYVTETIPRSPGLSSTNDERSKSSLESSRYGTNYSSPDSVSTAPTLHGELPLRGQISLSEKISDTDKIALIPPEPEPDDDDQLPEYEEYDNRLGEYRNADTANKAGPRATTPPRDPKIERLRTDAEYSSSSWATQYRDQVRGDIQARRMRREATRRRKIARGEMSEDSDDSAAADEIDEESGDNIFEFKIAIWFVGLSIEQLKTDTMKVLKILDVLFAENKEGVLECWYAPPKRNQKYSKSRDGYQPRRRTRGDVVHFELSFWKKRAQIVFSETYFHFKKLSGNIDDYEDIIQMMVATFEANWYSNESYPR